MPPLSNKSAFQKVYAMLGCQQPADEQAKPKVGVDQYMQVVFQKMF